MWFVKYLVVWSLSIATGAVAKPCQLEITGDDMMRFNKKQLTVTNSCKQVTLTLKHIGKLPKTAMGHNWVLSKTTDKNAIISAGITAGLTNGYLPIGDRRIIAATSLIGGGQQTTVTFSTGNLQIDQKYVFFCSFPGHYGVMVGDFIVKANKTKQPTAKQGIDSP